MKSIIFMITTLMCTSAFAGRYELHLNQKYPARTMLLDTQTGKMWTDTCFTEQKDGVCLVKAWAPARTIGITITEKDVWKEVEDVEKANAKAASN